MTWSTHVLAGVSSLWLLATLPPEALVYDLGTLAVFAALGALLPDLDASESKIKHLKLLGTNLKPFFGAARVVFTSDQHRGLLHSLIGWGMVGFMSLPLIVGVGWTPWAALMLGYGSHVVADSATKSGLMLLYPSRNRH